VGGAEDFGIAFLVTADDIAYTPREMETVRQLEAWWNYASRCVQLPADAPVCDFFWNAIAIIVAGVFALVALYMIRRMVRNFLAVRAENARIVERARVADADTMARHKADIAKQYAIEGEGSVGERIRRSLDERKTEEWGRPGASRDSSGPD